MLKRALITLSLMGSSMAIDTANLPVGEIETLNANYQTPKGVGTAEYINLQDFGSFESPSLEVENNNGLMIFSIDDSTFELDLSMLGITDAEEINLKNINFLNFENDIKLNIAQAIAQDPTFNLNLQKASINCKREIKYEDMTDDLLSACLKNSSFGTGKLKFKSEDSQFYNITNEEELLGDEIKLDYISFTIKNGSLNGKLKGSVTKGVKVKIKGTTAYDVEERKIALKLTKAKAGIINVKGTLFKELRKMQDEFIEVNEPYIYITLE